MTTDNDVNAILSAADATDTLREAISLYAILSLAIEGLREEFPYVEKDKYLSGFSETFRTAEEKLRLVDKFLNTLCKHP